MKETIPHKAQLPHPHTTEKWEQAFDALTDHVMILDHSGNIVWANRAIRDQVEPHLGPIVGHHYRLPYYGTILPKSPPPWETVFGRCAFSRSSRHPSRRCLVISYYPAIHYMDAQGTQWGAISVVKDITDRKRIEEALRKIAQSDPAPGSIAFLTHIGQRLMPSHQCTLRHPR